VWRRCSCCCCCAFCSSCAGSYCRCSATTAAAAGFHQNPSVCFVPISCIKPLANLIPELRWHLMPINTTLGYSSFFLSLVCLFVCLFSFFVRVCLGHILSFFLSFFLHTCTVLAAAVCRCLFLCPSGASEKFFCGWFFVVLRFWGVIFFLIPLPSTPESSVEKYRNTCWGGGEEERRRRRRRRRRPRRRSRRDVVVYNRVGSGYVDFFSSIFLFSPVECFLLVN